MMAKLEGLKLLHVALAKFFAQGVLSLKYIILLLSNDIMN
jgi:hypothetical protein